MTQSEWDRMLVTCFYKHMDARIGRLFVNYLEIRGLKRIPLFKWHNNLVVTRFVCGHIPKLGKVLWDRTEKDIDRIVKALTNSRLDTLEYPLDAKKDSADRQKMKRSLARNRLEAMGAAHNYRKSGGHDWNVCQ